VIIGPYTVDFLWPEARLIAEVDGWESHGTRSAFEADRVRDAWLGSRGYRVVRFTWRQVTRQGPEVARVARSILGVQ
jgi:very-short-patch-repair endonuclease